jgi:hypothetical protein
VGRLPPHFVERTLDLVDEGGETDVTFEGWSAGVSG